MAYYFIFFHIAPLHISLNIPPCIVSDLHISVSQTLLLSFLPAAADTCMQVRQFVCDVLESAVSFSISCSSLSVCVSVSAPDQTFHNFRSHKKLLTKYIVALFIFHCRESSSSDSMAQGSCISTRPTLSLLTRLKNIPQSLKDRRSSDLEDLKL